MNEPSFHPSAADMIENLRRQFPDTPFLALGQTALWDEPTKAAFRRALDAFWPEARLIAAAHDSDYFAKLPVHAPGAAKYVLVGHDDARTRGLWSAAGEMSGLFGSEDVPTMARLERAGVSLHRALRGLDDPAAFLGEITMAWSWTGIVHAEWGRKIAHDVPLSDILPTLLEQIHWAVNESRACVDEAHERSAQAVRDMLCGWVSAFAERHPAASLSDLYRDLFPRLYDLLLSAPPANLSTSNTLRLLKFNRATAGLPRFAFVDLFLRPETRHAAVNAYNLAVAGSEMYTLDRFGEGALPFDLVIPGHGRGTLRIHDATVTADLDKPVTLCDTCDLTSIHDLADLVERELGPDVALVGKAVTLIPMLAAEYIFVFHEGASGYTDRTRRLVHLLQERGAPVPDLRPILRVRHNAWDALDALGESVSFRLPEHLAQAFGRTTLPASEFAACWRCAVRQGEKRLQELSEARSPRDLFAYLARAALPGEDWNARAQEHKGARVRLLGLWDRAQAIQGRVYTLYDQVRQLRREVQTLEQAKGDDFRARVKPLREQLFHLGGGETDTTRALEQQIAALQAERADRFDREIRERHSQVRFALATVRDLKEKRLALERGPEAIKARETLQRIEAEAERARARLAANAVRVVQGLPHTNFRPSAWWFPLVDPSGAWFRRLSETAEYYLEPLRHV